MRTSLFAASAAVTIALAAPAKCLGEDVQCARCGMKVDAASRFASKIVQGDRTLMFCDVGDLLSYLEEKPAASRAAQVQDRPSGRWIRADEAFYVRSEKAFRTPMGWSIAAFAKEADAAAFGPPMNLASALRSLR